MACKGSDDDLSIVETTDETDEDLIRDIEGKLLQAVRESAAKTNPSGDVRHAATACKRAMRIAAREAVVRAKTWGKQFATRSLKEEYSPGQDIAYKAQETEERLAFYFEERMKAEKPCPSCPLPESQDTPHDVHRKALDECRPELIRKMRVNGTGLLDRLVSDDVFSDRRAESISGLKTSKLNRKVVDHVRALSRERFERVFIPALKEEAGNALLAHRLESTINRMLEQSRSETEHECKACPLRNLIDLSRLGDELLPLIDHVLYDDLMAGKLENLEAWRRVLGKVRHTQRMGPILQMKYPDVWKEMQDRDITTLECRCLGLGFCSPRQRSTKQSTMSSKEKNLAETTADSQKSQSMDEENPDVSLMNNFVEGEGLQSVGSTQGSSRDLLKDPL